MNQSCHLCCTSPLFTHLLRTIATDMILKRIAIALNNMGVALVDRGHFAEAITILEDAARILKLSLTLCSTPTPGEVRPNQSSVAYSQEKLRSASQRFARSSHTTKISQTTASCCVRVLSNMDMDYPDVKFLTDPAISSSSSKFFLIRLDLPSTASEEVNNVRFEAAVALYNPGIANLCCRIKKTSSLKLLGIAYKVLTNIRCNQAESQHELFHLSVRVVLAGRHLWALQKLQEQDNIGHHPIEETQEADVTLNVLVSMLKSNITMYNELCTRAQLRAPAA